MQYNKRVIELFTNPKNVGTLDENDPNVGTGEVGSPACGDVMRFQIKVDPETGRIVDAKFKTFGCGSAIASSALAIEKILGGTLEDALKITNKQLVEELELPPLKVHCSVLAEEGLRAAVEDYRRKQEELKKKPKKEEG